MGRSCSKCWSSFYLVNIHNMELSFSLPLMSIWMAFARWLKPYAVDSAWERISSPGSGRFVSKLAPLQILAIFRPINMGVILLSDGWKVSAPGL